MGNIVSGGELTTQCSTRNHLKPSSFAAVRPQPIPLVARSTGAGSREKGGYHISHLGGMQLLQPALARSVVSPLGREGARISRPMPEPHSLSTAERRPAGEMHDKSTGKVPSQPSVPQEHRRDPARAGTLRRNLATGILSNSLCEKLSALLYKDSRAPEARSRLPSTVTVAASRAKPDMQRACMDDEGMASTRRRPPFFFFSRPSMLHRLPFSFFVFSSLFDRPLGQTQYRLGPGLGGNSH